MAATLQAATVSLGTRLWITASPQQAVGQGWCIVALLEPTPVSRRSVQQVCMSASEVR
jgi:hypothetical protein